MEIKVEQKKSKTKDKRQIKKPEDILKLKEIQEIKDAVQEHLLLICLNTKNYINDIKIIGIGTNNSVIVDYKDIIRNVLLTNSSKVILVHNHPSTDLTPSKYDIDLTNNANVLLDAFNIQLLDHIIVSEDEYLSMGGEEYIDWKLDNKKEKSINKLLLIEENKNLRKQIEILNSKLLMYEKTNEEQDEEEDEL